MNSAPESMKEPPDNLTRSGMKSFSIALRTSIIGCISSIILVLLGILTIFFEKGDTTPGFNLSVILAIVVLIVCGAIALFTSLVGVGHGIFTLTEDKQLTKEVISALTKNISLSLGVLLGLLFVYKFLRSLFW